MCVYGWVSAQLPLCLCALSRHRVWGLETGSDLWHRGTVHKQRACRLQIAKQIANAAQRTLQCSDSGCFFVLWISLEPQTENLLTTKCVPGFATHPVLFIKHRFLSLSAILIVEIFIYSGQPRSYRHIVKTSALASVPTSVPSSLSSHRAKA